MPKTVKGKYISLTEDEYKLIEKVGNEYRIKICFARDDINGDTEKLLFSDVASGLSKNAVLQKYNITEYTFAQICNKRFGTAKIADVREAIRDEKMQSIIESRLKEPPKEVV